MQTLNQCSHCGCGEDIVLLDGSCGFNVPHCFEHRLLCDGPCRQERCRKDLRTHKDTGYILCKLCDDPLVIAAMKATMSGNFMAFDQFVKEFHRRTA